MVSPMSVQVPFLMIRFHMQPAFPRQFSQQLHSTSHCGKQLDRYDFILFYFFGGEGGLLESILLKKKSKNIRLVSYI